MPGPLVVDEQLRVMAESDRLEPLGKPRIAHACLPAATRMPFRPSQSQIASPASCGTSDDHARSSSLVVRPGRARRRSGASSQPPRNATRLVEPDGVTASQLDELAGHARQLDVRDAARELEPPVRRRAGRGRGPRAPVDVRPARLGQNELGSRAGVGVLRGGPATDDASTRARGCRNRSVSAASARVGRRRIVLTTTAPDSAVCTAFCTPLDEIGSSAMPASPTLIVVPGDGLRGRGTASRPLRGPGLTRPASLLGGEHGAREQLAVAGCCRQAVRRRQSGSTKTSRSTCRPAAARPSTTRRRAPGCPARRPPRSAPVARAGRGSEGRSGSAVARQDAGASAGGREKRASTSALSAPSARMRHRSPSRRRPRRKPAGARVTPCARACSSSSRSKRPRSTSRPAPRSSWRSRGRPSQSTITLSHSRERRPLDAAARP